MGILFAPTPDTSTRNCALTSAGVANIARRQSLRFRSAAPTVARRLASWTVLVNFMNSDLPGSTPAGYCSFARCLQTRTNFGSQPVFRAVKLTCDPLAKAIFGRGARTNRRSPAQRIFRRRGACHGAGLQLHFNILDGWRRQIAGWTLGATLAAVNHFERRSMQSIGTFVQMNNQVSFAQIQMSIQMNQHLQCKSTFKK